MCCDINDERVFCWEKNENAWSLTRGIYFFYSFFCSFHSSGVLPFLSAERKPCQIERMSAKYKPTSAIQYSVRLIQQNESAIRIKHWRMLTAVVLVSGHVHV